MIDVLTCLLTVLLIGPPLLAAAYGRMADAQTGTIHLRRTAGALWCTAATSVAVLVAAALAGEPLVIGPIALGGAALVLTPLIAFVAAIVATFSVPYMAADPRPRVYTERLLVLATAALIVGISRDAVLFTLAWVATGPLLAMLVGHAAGWRPADAARDRMLRVFAMGDAALVVGVAVLCVQAGSTRIATIGAAAGAMVPVLRDLALAGILAGAVVRSAILPASGWLLTSITAPTPVSALMHAGLVNAGGIAIALWAPVVAGAPYMLHVVFALGAATALVGSASMLVRPDVKRALAASTMGQMGFMMMQAGLGQIAYALYHLAAHGLFKATLFLGAGSAVGVRKPAAPRPLAAVATALAAALVILGAAAWLPWLDLALNDPATLLGLFAVLAAAQAAADLPRRETRAGDVVQGIALIGGCAGLYVGGLGLVSAVLGPLASIPGMTATPVHWLVGVIFGALWLTQLAASARGLPLPAPVYTRLMALGRPRATDADAALHTAGRRSRSPAPPETPAPRAHDQNGRTDPSETAANAPAVTGETP
jgi:NAD(P)H-quinone oxidoreductase subunit 5